MSFAIKQHALIVPASAGQNGHPIAMLVHADRIIEEQALLTRSCHTSAQSSPLSSHIVNPSVDSLSNTRPTNGGTMTSIDAMGETEAREYIRAEIIALRPILGELIPAFWQTLTDQWKRDGRAGISPLTRCYSVDELSKMATEWLRTRNAQH